MPTWQAHSTSSGQQKQEKKSLPLKHLVEAEAHWLCLPPLPALHPSLPVTVPLWCYSESLPLSYFTLSFPSPFLSSGYRRTFWPFWHFPSAQISWVATCLWPWENESLWVVSVPEVSCLQCLSSFISCPSVLLICQWFLFNLFFFASATYVSPGLFLKLCWTVHTIFFC